jgi:hypothetical protein
MGNPGAQEVHNYSFRLFDGGDQFVVIGQGDTVIFKAITPPSIEEFSGLLDEASVQAKKAGMKPGDVKAALRKARRKR